MKKTNKNMSEDTNNQEQITGKITEKDFLAHFNNQEFELLSKWLVKTALEDISKTDIHPYLRVQAEQACESILMNNKHKNRSYEDFLRGAKLATKVVALAIPNSIEAYHHAITN